MFRVGILYRIADLLDFLQCNAITRPQFECVFTSWRGASGHLALKTAVACGWIEETAEGDLALTDAGKTLQGLAAPAVRLRYQLKALIAVKKPTWVNLTVRGRNALRQYAPSAVVQCFDEAGLFDRDDNETVAWWDTLCQEIRGSRNRAMVDTGRDGERRSIAYEQRRTGHPPVWMALNNADAGYDILSVVSAEDRAPLAIEVKASDRAWQSAAVHLTEHEWETLRSCQSAVIHLWSFAARNALLAVVNVETVAIHIAENRSEGRWQEVVIPFQALAATPIEWEADD